MRTFIVIFALLGMLGVPAGAVSAESHSLKIIELDNQREFVLIKNEGSTAVNLKGWQLHDRETGKGKKNTYTFNELLLRPGEMVQIQSGISKKKQQTAPDSAKLKHADHFILWSSRKVWNDKGDTAYLRDQKGSIVAERTSAKAAKTAKKTAP